MQSILFTAAAVAALVTFCVHTFVGGRVVATPLLADQSLPRASKWLNYYCWHITTIQIFAMAYAFAHMVITGPNIELAVFVSSLALLNAVLSAAVALKGRINPLRFPSTSLFTVTAGLGWVAVLVG